MAAVPLAALLVNAAATAQAAPAPSVTVIGTTMSPYGALEVDGVSGFAANAALTFTIDGTDVTDELVHTTTESDGSISQVLGNLRLPGASGGSLGTHTLTVTDTAGGSASVTLKVIPSPVATPASLARTVSQMRTTGVTVRFDGFLPGETVEVGMASQINGSPCGAPLTADTTGSVTATCVWTAAYTKRFGQTPGPDSYFVGANNSIYTIYSAMAAVTVSADAVAVPPTTKPPTTQPPTTQPPTSTPAAAPAARPAVAVRDHARFTG
ncbi:hypothetical protein [Angustibacter sp. Root456]|uniref:hypothetical protein n=1 Tax=Angustibacter sp. Root456 TaxID=1736539 RepID=UPI0006FFE415|nr:hypothetical protein [Angustibacter sp. Root456]KQX64389.1 hypothetical protein ASD06_09400 [Angustibacter sp. Root456]